MMFVVRKGSIRAEQMIGCGRERLRGMDRGAEGVRGFILVVYLILPSISTPTAPFSALYLCLVTGTLDTGQFFQQKRYSNLPDLHSDILTPEVPSRTKSKSMLDPTSLCSKQALNRQPFDLRFAVGTTCVGLNGIVG